MLFVIGGELREVSFPPAITNEQWAEIEQLSGLPAEARSELDECIGYCREVRLDATRKYDEDWFNILSGVFRAERESKRALDRLISRSRFFDALAMGLDGQDRIPDKEREVIHSWLTRLSKEKQALLDWYQNAAQRVHHDRTGQKTGRIALIMLVQDINGCLLRHTGKQISASKSMLKFVVEICVIAFPELRDPDPKRKEKSTNEPNDKRGDSRAYRRVKKVVELPREKAAEEGWGELSQWQRLMPGWKPLSRLQLSGEGIRIYYRMSGESGGELRVKKRKEIKMSEFIFPTPPLASDEVAARQMKKRPPPDSVWNRKGK